MAHRWTNISALLIQVHSPHCRTLCVSCHICTVTDPLLQYEKFSLPYSPVHSYSCYSCFMVSLCLAWLYEGCQTIPKASTEKSSHQPQRRFHFSILVSCKLCVVTGVPAVLGNFEMQILFHFSFLPAWTKFCNCTFSLTSVWSDLCFWLLQEGCDVSLPQWTIPCCLRVFVLPLDVCLGLLNSYYWIWPVLFCILDSSPLSDVCLANITSHLVACLHSP